jgi:lysophospholipase L1-like esterase
MRWFHDECAETDDRETMRKGAWNCLKCRQMPVILEQLHSIVLSLRDEIETMATCQNKTEKALVELKEETRKLRQENQDLQAQIRIREAAQTENPQPSPDDKDDTLVIGDSLLRNLDQSKLQATKVASVSGAKVEDITQELEREKPYGRIVCCIGTNDCGTNAFSGDEFSAKAERLVEKAKEKVQDPKAVVVCSLPPRTDKKEYQENVELANACLASLAEKSHVTFVNNDSSFKLADGSANDGYLHHDGLHLSNSGTRRLALNMSLNPRDGADGDVTRYRGPRQMTDGNRPWRPQPSPTERVSRVTCWTCGRQGHKARWCQEENERPYQQRRFAPMPHQQHRWQFSAPHRR